MVGNERNTLLLFTNNYPFGKANEIYIDNEIEYLSAGFEKVYIMPVGYRNINRLSIDNVEAIDLTKYVRYSKYGFLKNLASIRKFVKEESRNENSLDKKMNYKKAYNAVVYRDAVLSFLKERELVASEVVLYSYWFYHSALVCAVLKRYDNRFKAISRAHLQDLYGEFSKHVFTRSTLKGLDKVYAISENGAEHLRSSFPEYAAKIDVAYLGVKDYGVNELEFDPNRFVVASCSTMREDKRIDKIIEVLSLLKFPVTWTHFGHGKLLDEMREKAKSLPSHITAELPGFVPNIEVNEFYKNNQVNLFLNFSKAEGVPVSIMEVISFGIPVMATAIYGTPEAVTEDVGVLIAKDFDVEDVAKQIEQFKDSAMNQPAFRKRVRSHWEKRFSASVNYPKLTDELLSD